MLRSGIGRIVVLILLALASVAIAAQAFATDGGSPGNAGTSPLEWVLAVLMALFAAGLLIRPRRRVVETGDAESRAY